MQKRRKVSVGFYLTKELLARAKAVSKSVGIPVSTLVEKGLTKQVEKWEGMEMFTRYDVELGK